MKHTIQRMLSSLLVIFCIISQMIVNTSCMHRAQYTFDQDAENIQTIEIVEAYYDHDTSSGTQKVLVNIDDIDYFIKQIKEIKLQPDIVDPDDVEMLQDLILTCVNEALRKVDSAQAAQFGKYNIPGLM